MTEVDDGDKRIVAFAPVAQINKAHLIMIFKGIDLPPVNRGKERKAAIFSSCFAAFITSVSGTGTRLNVSNITTWPSRLLPT